MRIFAIGKLQDRGEAFSAPDDTLPVACFASDAGSRRGRARASEVVTALLEAASQYQLVRQVGIAFDVGGWRLAANSVRLVAADGRADRKRPERCTDNTTPARTPASAKSSRLRQLI